MGIVSYGVQLMLRVEFVSDSFGGSDWLAGRL